MHFGKTQSSKRRMGAQNIPRCPPRYVVRRKDVGMLLFLKTETYKKVCTVAMFIDLSRESVM